MNNPLHFVATSIATIYNESIQQSEYKHKSDHYSVSIRSHSKMVKTVGIDIGSQKCVLVADDAELVRTSTGSISRPTLVAFVAPQSRYVGEEAAAYIAGESTLPMLNVLLGKSLDEIKALEITAHIKPSLVATDNSEVVGVGMTYCGESKTFPINALGGMYIAKLWDRVVEVYGTDVNIAFSLPTSFSDTAAKALYDSCTIAGVDTSKVSIVDSSDSLLSTYSRKLSALRPAEKANLEVHL